MKKEIRGFVPVSIRPLEGISAKLHFYRHEKTGAELIWLERESENKTFSIAFQTLPEDDTGVFHILEHSVLCGSEKYPVKEPFVELLKGSMNTFLNAMTFPDKTVYPVSSRNDTDFRNLMHIYLDAVLFPNIYRNPNIFRQEGWHYELDTTGKPNYVGVVFGEMKGAFSSVDQVIQTKLNRLLFPNNCYGFCSGGDPKHIPELTYEQFIRSHQRFYHPSGAKIFLDGTLDIESILADIDSEYLSRFDRREPDFTFTMQPTVPACSETVSYEIQPEEPKDGKAHFVLGKVVGSWRDVEKLTALAVLLDYLAGSNSAPVTAAVLQQGLGQDFGIGINDYVAQPYIMVQVRNCAEGTLPNMKEQLQQIFQGVLHGGLCKEELTASLNRLEFQNRESQEPYGVGLAIKAYKSWMFGGDPAMYMDLSPVFASLREKLDSDYFGKLLTEVFLDDAGMAELHVLPSDTLGAETIAAETSRLEAAAAAWSEAERAEVQQAQQDLSCWQQSPDSPEALASIPHLQLSDLSAEPLWTACDQKNRGSVPILRPQVSTNSTVYLNLYFALPPMKPEQLSAANLLTRLLGAMPTHSHSRSDLQREIKTWLGKLEFELKAMGKPDQPDSAVCYLHVGCSVLESNLSYGVRLIRAVLLETQLDHRELVEEILQQSYLMAQQDLIMSGHQYAITHALSGLTARGAANEAIEGYGYYQYLKSAAEAFDFSKTKCGMESLLASLPRLPLTVGVSGTVSGEVLDTLLDGFGGGESAPTVTLGGIHTAQDSIAIPAGIAYGVQGGNLVRLGSTYHGSFALAAKILSLSYLWNEVRVQGGAYGAGMAASPDGDIFCYSYRDPNPARTMGIYGGAADYLRRFCENRGDFRQLIIGAVSDSEPLQSKETESRMAVERYMQGITLEQKRHQRQELLNASYEDLLRFCDILDRWEAQKATCIIGSEPILAACDLCAGNRLS